jgi:hypothetical protein
LHYCVDTETGEKLEILDRIFYDDEQSKLTLQKWRREQEGMTRFQFHENTSIRGESPVECEYDFVPYIDTLHQMRDIDGEYYLTNSKCGDGYYVDGFQQTGGGSDDGNVAGIFDAVYCEDTGEMVTAEDAYYCETNEVYYETTDDLVYIDYAYYLSDDERVAYDEYQGEYAMRDDLIWIECDDIYVSDTEGYIYCEIGSCEGEYLSENDVVATPDGYCNEYDAAYIIDEDIYVYDTSNYFEHDDGDWYSYPEEDEDEDEVA